MAATPVWRETDLYPPVKRHLESLGFTVRSEVNDCDVVGVRGGDIVVVELKRHLSHELLVQAIDRQDLTEAVYIALPRPKRRGQAAKWHGIHRLLKRLGLGLLFVSAPGPDTRVTVELDPSPCARRQNGRKRSALLREFHSRSGDYNSGGATRRPLVTAYREQAIRIARLLDERGAMRTRDLRACGTGEKTRDILYQNYYGWFVRESRGVYKLTEKGRSELAAYIGVTGDYSASPAGMSEPAPV